MGGEREGLGGWEEERGRGGEGSLCVRCMGEGAEASSPSKCRVVPHSQYSLLHFRKVDVCSGVSLSDGGKVH